MPVRGRFLTALVAASTVLQACDTRRPAQNRPDSVAAGAAPTKPFKVAFNTWIGYSPLVIADRKGFLKAEGLDVEFSTLEGVAEKNSSLIQGTVDAVGHTADAAVVSAASGVDGQIVFVFDRSFGSDGIVTKRSVNSMKDLVGHKVALEPGFTGHFFFLTLLRDEGIDPSQVQIIPMETGAAGSAFVAGRVEAAMTWQPWLGKVEQTRPDSKVLFSSASSGKDGRIIDILYMNRSVVQSRRADVVKLVRAMGRATDWYLEPANKAAGDSIMAAFWKLSPEEQRETVAGMKFMRLTENATFFGTSANPGPLFGVVNMAADLWLKTDVINKDVGRRELVAFDVMNEAATKPE